MINRAIVRDGKPYPPASMEEFEFVDSVKSVLRELRSRGFILFVFTNQPDIARGRQSLSTLNQFHELIQWYLPVEKIYVCPHDDAENCDCRKPRPGMLTAAAREYALNLKICFAVGDRWRDMDAGHAAGVRTIFLDYGYRESLRTTPDFQVTNLSEILKIIPES